MKLNQSLIYVAAVLSIQACSSTPRILSVRSNPAEAEVCIKGKPGSHYFGQSKNCIGATPLEVDSITVTDDAGKKRLVRLKDIEEDKEQFYLVVSRQGYAPQSMTVPGWEHFVALQEEQAKKEAIPVPMTVISSSDKGSAKISSDPVGALVYVNDFLKGNTPYVLEGENGQTVRLKVEQAGYRSIERSITIDSGKSMNINLTMEKEESRSVASQQAAQ